MKKILSVFLLTVSALNAQLYSQELDTLSNLNATLDSIYILETEGDQNLRAKVLHAEPLFIDLIRDLGARKGENEWNVGMGMTDNVRYDLYTALIEYEFAPIDRLGLEIELPFSFYGRNGRETEIPSSKLDGLKLAAQWSFLVSTKFQTTLALGYLHEFAFTPFKKYGSDQLYVGNIYNPFFVAAKRWGRNFHTLIYAGPETLQKFETGKTITSAQINTNFHYMISGTRNFVGIELNKDITKGDFDMVIRPQLRVSISENLLVGIVTGIPIERESERVSSFMRIIYEPGHQHKKPIHNL